MDEEYYNSLIEEALGDLDVGFGLPGNFRITGLWSGVESDPNGKATAALLDNYRRGTEFSVRQKLSFAGKTDLLKEISKSTFAQVEAQHKNSAYDYMMDKLSFHMGMSRCCGEKSLVGRFTGNKQADENTEIAFRNELIGHAGTQVASTTMQPGYSTTGLINAQENEDPVGVVDTVDEPNASHHF